MTARKQRFIHGVPELLILRLLSREERYGYDIVRAIRLVSGDVLKTGEGVIYPVLHELESSGKLASRKKKVSGRQRVYYRLTPRGRKHLDGLQSEWDAVVGAVDRVLRVADE